MKMRNTLAGIFVFSILGSNYSTSIAKNATENLNGYENKIPSYSVDPYTKKDYPSTFAQYKKRINDVNNLRIKAAKLAIDSGRCDKVSTSSINDKSQINSLEFIVYCSNGATFNITESDIKSKAQIKTDKEKSIPHEEALSKCKEIIIKESEIPSSVNFHNILGTNIRTAPISNNVVVNLEFDVRNTFNAKIEYIAQCFFEPNGKVSHTVNLKR